MNARQKAKFYKKKLEQMQKPRKQVIYKTEKEVVKYMCKEIITDCLLFSDDYYIDKIKRSNERRLFEEHIRKHIKTITDTSDRGVLVVSTVEVIE